MSTYYILQEMMFPKTGIFQPLDCYFHTNGSFCSADQKVTLQPNDFLVTDSWFNAFDIDFWREKTSIQSFGIRVRMQGSFRIRIFVSTDPRNHKQHQIYVQKYTYKDDQVHILELPDMFSLKEMHGFLTIEIVGMNSAHNPAVFFGGEFYTCDAPVRTPKIGMVVCTFKREKYLFPNVQQWRADLLDAPVWKDRFKLFLIDNGGTIPDMKCSNIVQITNSNSGGAGGFTRGMMAVADSADCTHTLLMDDDLTLHSGILKRAWSLASYLKEKCCISAAMVNLDSDMSTLHEWGGILLNDAPGAGMNRPIAFRWDITLFSSLFRTLGNSVGFNYGAWWWFLYPTEVQRSKDMGFAFPFFVKGDDIDFSVRLSQNDYEIVFPIGFSVWHEPFFNKLSPFHEYLATRNQLVLSALHNIRYLSYKKLLKRLFELILTYQYETAELTMDGVRDYLAGPSVITEKPLDYPISFAKKVKLEKVKPLGKEVVTENHSLRIKESFIHRAIRVFTLNGLLLPNNRSDTAVFLAWDNGVWVRDVYRCQKVTYVRQSVNECYSMKCDRIKIFRLMILAFFLACKFRLGRKKADKTWYNSYKELTGRKFWEKYLSIDVNK